MVKITTYMHIILIYNIHTKHEFEIEKKRQSIAKGKKFLKDINYAQDFFYKDAVKTKQYFEKIITILKY